MSLYVGELLVRNKAVTPSIQQDGICSNSYSRQKKSDGLKICEVKAHEQLVTSRGWRRLTERKIFLNRLVISL